MKGILNQVAYVVAVVVILPGFSSSANDHGHVLPQKVC